MLPNPPQFARPTKKPEAFPSRELPSGAVPTGDRTSLAWPGVYPPARGGSVFGFRISESGVWKIHNSQSAIRNPQFAIRNSQSAIRIFLVPFPVSHAPPAALSFRPAGPGQGGPERNRKNGLIAPKEVQWSKQAAFLPGTPQTLPRQTHFAAGAAARLAPEPRNLRVHLF